MNGHLVDTNIPSELTRPISEPRVEAFLRRVKAQTFISALSIGEIRKGVSSLPQSARRKALEDWMANEMLPWFGERILSVTIAIAERWGELAAQSKTQGRTLPVIDGLIAATAIEHSLTVVTRNVPDFAGLEVPILNPWQAS